jgi:hypothetical protein
MKYERKERTMKLDKQFVIDELKMQSEAKAGRPNNPR